MKRLIPMIVSMIALVIIGISLTLAWYTNRVETEVIDANTKGISFIYNINDNQEVNVPTYEVKNLTFFDIDNEVELPFFESMALKLEVILINTSNKAINLNVSQSEVSKVESDINGEKTSSAYVQCVFSEVNQLDYTGVKTIEELIPNPNTLSKNLEAFSTEIVNGVNEISNNCKYVFYIYVFGVQEIDSASNDFLKQKFNFLINIDASVKGDN